MSKISAGTTTATGLVQTSDTTGNLELQTNNGTTAVTFDTSQNASFAGDISVQGGNYLSSQPSFRNIIINGDMQIAQRSTSVAGITSTGYYTVDRFDIGGTAFGTVTQSQDSDVPTGQGFNKSIKFLWTTANASLGATSFLQLHQSIEGQNLQHLKKGTANAESVTVSFWVKSNKTGTYIIRLADNDNTKMICKSYTITVADTWEKKTFTFVGDTADEFTNDNGRSLDLVFGLCAGTNHTSGTLQTTWGTDTQANRYVGQVNLADAVNNYINITGVQLEVGSQATPFEHRPYDVELARCQRYYYVHADGSGRAVGPGAMYTASVAYVNIKFPVTMRDDPSVEISSATNFRFFSGNNLSVPTTMAIWSQSNPTNEFISMSGLTGKTQGHAGFADTNDAACKLAFSAEL